MPSYFKFLCFPVCQCIHHPTIVARYHVGFFHIICSYLLPFLKLLQWYLPIYPYIPLGLYCMWLFPLISEFHFYIIYIKGLYTSLRNRRWIVVLYNTSDCVYRNYLRNDCRRSLMCMVWPKAIYLPSEPHRWLGCHNKVRIIANWKSVCRCYPA